MKLYCKLVFYSFIFHILVSMHACVSWNYVSLVFIYLVNSFDERDLTSSWISLELEFFGVILFCWGLIFNLIKIFRISYFSWRIRSSNWGFMATRYCSPSFSYCKFFLVAVTLQHRGINCGQGVLCMVFCGGNLAC